MEDYTTTRKKTQDRIEKLILMGIEQYKNRFTICPMCDGNGCGLCDRQGILPKESRKESQIL